MIPSTKTMAKFPNSNFQCLNPLFFSIQKF
jgi:hypothetical protein